MMGSLFSTSAMYIFNMPELTLSHVFTADMSSSIGECHRSDAQVLIELMNFMHAKYR